MKITKREYTKQMNELTDALTALETDIARIIDNEIVAEFDGLNAKHDKVWEMEQAIKDIERAFTTRNWTCGDWASYSLVAQNID
jgi:hypothetical protein